LELARSHGSALHRVHSRRVLKGVAASVAPELQDIVLPLALRLLESAFFVICRDNPAQQVGIISLLEASNVAVTAHADRVVEVAIGREANGEERPGNLKTRSFSSARQGGACYQRLRRQTRPPLLDSSLGRRIRSTIGVRMGSASHCRGLDCQSESVLSEINGGRTRTRTLDPLIKSQVAMRRYKDLAVKYPRIGVFNLNGLRADCKMDRGVLGLCLFGLPAGKRYR
jgi:hypothetical protein